MCYRRIYTAWFTICGNKPEFCLIFVFIQYYNVKIKTLKFINLGIVKILDSSTNRFAE